jgi:hypothetical protein
LPGGSGREARRDTKVYLTGGATAVLHGWRAATLDIDVRLEPEAYELLLAIARLKDELDLNVELPSPPDFIPELPGWRERSPFVLREGPIDVHDFDFYSQALSKIERGFEQDLEDVAAMLRDALVQRDRPMSSGRGRSSLLDLSPEASAPSISSRARDAGSQ